MLKDYLIFQGQQSGNKSGYSHFDDSMNNGPKFNFFGQEILGIFVEDGVLNIELSKLIDNEGDSLSLPYNKPFPTTEEASVEYSIESLRGEFPIGKIAIYNTTSLDQINSQAVNPIYQRTVKLRDTLVVSNSTQLTRTLTLPANTLQIDEGSDYCVVLTVADSVLEKLYGIATVESPSVDFQYDIENLRTDIRTSTLYINRDNEIKVNLTHKTEPVDLSTFDRFELYGLTQSPLSTDTNQDFFNYGNNQGDVVLNLGSVIQSEGVYDTSLVGYSDQHPSGIVLWDKSLIKSRLKISAIEG